MAILGTAGSNPIPNVNPIASNQVNIPALLASVGAVSNNVPVNPVAPVQPAGTNTSITPLPTKQSSTQTATGSQTTSGSSQSSSTTAGSSQTASTNQAKTKKKNMSDEALNALNQLIADLQGGGDPVNSALDNNLLRALGVNAEVDAGLNPTDVEARAQGRVQNETRTLLEQILPEIYGSAEASGTGENVLADLLSQDAAVRTAEASARIVEQSLNEAVNTRIQNQQALNTLLASGNATQDALLEALGIAKGAVENTDTVETGSSVTNSLQSTVGSESSSSTTNTNNTTSASSEMIDPLAWANLMAQINQSNQNQPTGNEKALALFQSLKDPWMTSGALSNSLRPSSASGAQLQDATQGLFNLIKGMV